MEHVKQWEWSQGHSWVGDRLQRATREAAESTHRCEVCEKVCKSKAGLTIHRKRIHEVSLLKKTFACTKCKEVFLQEANLRNHKKKCVGGEAAPPKTYKAVRKPCPDCGKVMAATNKSRHQKEACKGGGVNP